MPDGRNFDGQHLLTLLHPGNSPLDDTWDVNLLIQEIEENLCTRVVDIPCVSRDANNYNIHVKLVNGKDVIARLARVDVNMPSFEGFPIHAEVPEVKFEAEVFELLRSEPDILASRLLYHRLPVQHEGPRLGSPQDILGRRLLVFRRAEGEKDVWHDLNPAQKAWMYPNPAVPPCADLAFQCSLLSQAGRIRASLYGFQVPPEFASAWLRERLFEPKPESFPIPVAPTREFCVALFNSKVEATIKNVGDMIGWEDDHNTVGPVAAAAKQSLLRLIPHIMPAGDDEKVLYRFVLEDSHFGLHNISVVMDEHSQLLATSLFDDWDTGCIVPAILSDPRMAATVDLVVDKDAAPALTRLPRTVTADELERIATWPRHYFESLFLHAPDYKRAIRMGKDARHLWFALWDWRGDDPGDYFGALGGWAEKRLKKIGVDQDVK